MIEELRKLETEMRARLDINDYWADRLAAILASAGEPCAWRYRLKGDVFWCYDDDRDWVNAEFENGEVEPLYAAPQAAPVQSDDTHAFKNFHRSLCERFGYTHDEKDWRRDQVSLEEHIAKLVPRYRKPPPDPCDEREVAPVQSAGEAVSDYTNLLPGSYYMDPPDGGDVSPLEQMRRMAEDAAHYRWLRDHDWLTTLAAVVEFAGKAAKHWDADEDAKAGKMLLALAGRIPGYHVATDEFHRLIEGMKIRAAAPTCPPAGEGS